VNREWKTQLKSQRIDPNRGELSGTLQLNENGVILRADVRAWLCSPKDAWRIISLTESNDTSAREDAGVSAAEVTLALSTGTPIALTSSPSPIGVSPARGAQKPAAARYGMAYPRLGG
jgi:hypothetical protein